MTVALKFLSSRRRWRRTLDVVLRHTHYAGEKLFVDYAGQTISVTDPVTVEIRDTYLFMAALGASSHAFAWASLSQSLPSWIEANVRALQFFSGVPEIVMPDNVKIGVKKPCYYEPDINQTYHRMVCHYGTVIIPARTAKPKDKATVKFGGSLGGAMNPGGPVQSHLLQYRRAQSHHRSEAL